jgi:methylated-DNA-[protein]-cysteine S-methyltransferase
MAQATDQAKVFICTLDTPLGEATATAQDSALTGFWFNRQKYFPVQNKPWACLPNHVAFTKLKTWLAEYFTGINKPHDFSLAPQGSDFQKAVWDLLLKIPFGEVTTYGEIARVIAAERGISAFSAQAVGGAVGRNPISILIPCHRVIGTDRSLTGYGGGLDKKEALLRVENINLATARMYQLA